MTEMPESGTRAQDLLDALADAIVITSASGTITAANEACVGMLGYESGELVGKAVEVLLPDRFRVAHVAHRSVYGDKPWSRPMGSGLALVARRRDGSEFPVEVSLTPVRGGEEPVVVACIRPLAGEAEGAALEESARRAGALVDLSWSLATGGIDALDAACRHVGEQVGDVCMVSVRGAGESGEFLDPVAVHHPDPETTGDLLALVTLNRVRVGEGIAGRVVATGEGVVVPSAVAEDVVARMKPEHREFARRLGIHSLMVLPLRTGGEVVGTLGVCRTRPGRPYTESERVFVEAIAAGAARAVVAARDAEPGAKDFETLRHLAEIASDVIYRIRLWPDVGFEYASPAVTRLTGYEPAELCGDPRLVERIVHVEDRSKLERLARDAPLEGPIRLRWMHKDGRVVWTEHRVGTVVDDDGRVVALEGMARDVTSTVAVEESLSHRAMHDHLTGLANRDLFVDRLGRALARLGRRPGSLVGVLFVDLDGFKAVNDEFGHLVGDDVLMAVAERLAGAVRPEDTVARFGGDEFVVVIEASRAEDVERVADRVLLECARPVDVGAEQVRVTASVGIASTGDAEVPVENLVRRADNALYRAKRRGGNRRETYGP